MADPTEAHLARLQAIMTEFLKHRIGQSLERVELALKGWRSQRITEFEAHAEMLRHAVRTERLAARMARVELHTAGSLMRDAFDVGILDENEFRELIGCEPMSVEPSPVVEEEDDDDTSPLPDKRGVVDELLEAGAVLVHVDARCEGICVPDQFENDSKLVLRFGYNLTPVVPDLHIDDEGVHGTLTFGGIPHRCVLPWASIYAVVSDVNSRGLVWPDDVPDDVIGELANSADGGHRDAPEAVTASETKPASKGSHLRLVK